MRIKFAFATCIFLCVAAVADQPKRGMSTGFVELTVFDQALQANEKIIVLLRKEGNSLELVDLFGNTKHKTKIIETRPWGMEGARLHTANFDFSDAGTFHSASRISFSTSDNKRLSAVWESKDQQSTVSVRALSLLYACGNHKDPMHTAESDPEMKDKTARYGCSGWHQLKQSDYK